MAFDPRQRPLTPIEARVLATLVEKSRTVPDSYPLTVNSLLAGCNQKTSREPLMQLSESEVLHALDELRALALVVEIGGARVARWEHNFERGVGVPTQAAALLCLLVLRAPQTSAELRANAERWHRFADISSVQAFLEELAERAEDKGGPLVLQLPRAPGAREARWAQLLCGPPPDTQPDTPAGGRADALCGSALAERVQALEDDLAQLRAQLHELRGQLGEPSH